MTERISIKPGIYEDVPFEEYTAWDAINNSSLSAAKRSMLHYKEQPSLSDTPSLRFGRLVHGGKLEPMKMATAYAVLPDFAQQLADKYMRPKATKEYAQLVEAWTEQQMGKEVVTQDQWDRLLGVLGALDDNERCRAWLRKAQFELSICWEDPASGLLCKARLDVWQKLGRRIVDLKTTRDAHSFERAIGNYDYHRQAAFYLDGATSVGLPADEFCFVAVESEPPHGCRAAPLSQDALIAGRELYRGLLIEIAECRELDTWPSYSNPEQWRLPAWAMQQETDDNTSFTMNGQAVSF